MSEEADYWKARDEREQAMFHMMQDEQARKARRRKTLPWNILGGILALGLILPIIIGIATT